jgi:hypothetical protein
MMTPATPAPVAIVSLRRSNGGSAAVHDISMLLDTGADVTLLPRSAITRLGLAPQPGTQYELIGFDGVRAVADAVDLDMLFLNRAFRGRYLLTDDEHGIMGRDVLASLRLLFDGPAQAWSEQTVSG